MKANNLMLGTFLLPFRFICQKTRIQCTFHIIYKHKAGILLKCPDTSSLALGVFFFFLLLLLFELSQCSYVCHLMQSTRLLSYYSLYTDACAQESKLKVPKTFTKINDGEKREEKFIWIFQMCVFFSCSPLLTHCCKMQSAIIWKDGNQRNGTEWKEIRWNRLKPKQQHRNVYF